MLMFKIDLLHTFGGCRQQVDDLQLGADSAAVWTTDLQASDLQSFLDIQSLIGSQMHFPKDTVICVT